MKKMRFRKIFGICISLMLIYMTVPMSIGNEQSTVSIEDCNIENIGDTKEINITLDTAPQGLSGYNITVSIQNVEIAEIIGIEFPSWATLHDNSSLPADSIWIKAVDLMENVDPGDTNIKLVKLIIRGDASGNTVSTVFINRMDDDTGNPISPTEHDGSIIIGEGGLSVNADGPYSGVVNTVIQFYGSAWGGTSPYSFHWNFGDGNESNQQNPTHTYAQAGDYTVILTVTDSEQNVAYDQTLARIRGETNEIFIPDKVTAPETVVNIPIFLNIIETDGLGSIQLYISYDASVIHVNNVEKSDNSFDVLSHYVNHENGEIGIVGYQTGVNGVGPGNITFATINCNAIGNSGDFSYLNISVDTITNNTGVSVAYEVINGSLEIGLKGDYSGDGIVNIWDCTYLARHLVGIPGYEKIYYADISGDGLANIWDCTYLARHLVGIPGYELH